jgi:hypothetical protein
MNIRFLIELLGRIILFGLGATFIGALGYIIWLTFN